MIGALLRMPWERVVRRMLEQLHAQSFEDVEMAHMNLLLYPGPQGTRPSELAAQRGISKQAAIICSASSKRSATSSAGPTLLTADPSASPSPTAVSGRRT